MIVMRVRKTIKKMKNTKLIQNILSEENDMKKIELHII